MSWYMQWSDSIKKRACRYLLQRYVGQFLEEKLTLDKLSVNICSGTGSVSNVSLDAQALNELGAQKNLPIEFVDGFISEIAVSIPWATLFTDSIYLEVTGMHITIQPKQRPDDAGSMLESMWSSMASSIQLAAECLKQESNSIDGKEPENENSMEGLEIFANAIESILTRVKIKLIDTRIRLEHLPREGKNGIALEIKLKVIEYCDETSCEWGVVGDSTDTQKSPSSFSIKKFHCDGITFYTDEFPVENRTFSRSIIIEDEKLSKSTDKIKEASEPILIGMLSGSNVVRVKLKLDPNINEPKVDLEFILGSFTFFLSPRQLYLVIEILQSLASPHNQDTSNVVSKKTPPQKIMSSNDFKKVEQDLQETLNFPAYNSYQMPKINHGKGWSSASFDEGDEEFHPMKLTNLMSGSVTSTATDASFSSHASTYASKPESAPIGYDFPSFNGPFRKKFDRGSIYDAEVMEETSAFHFQLTSVSAVILHEDILTFGLDTCELTPSSVSTMKNLSNKFFTQLGKFVLAGNKDFEAFKQALSKTCSLNHIRLLGTTIIIEGNDAGNNSSSCFSSVISAASVELLECLVESSSTSDGKPQYVELLKFMKSRDCDESISPAFPISNQPDVRVHLQHSKRNHNSKRSSRFEISINLEQCWTEVDLSIFDRISSMLNSHSLCHVKNTPKDFMDQQVSFTQALESASLVDKSFFLKVQSPFFVVKFRFPIPDLRPAHEKGKFPWWQRSIRKDVLYLNLLETSFHTDQSSKSLVQEYILSCKEVTFLFKEGNTDFAIPFIHSSSLFPSSQMNASSEPCPRLIVKLLPTEVVMEEEIIREKEDNSGLSYSTYMDNPSKDPSPFMTKKVVHENDPHHPAGDGEELVIPALDKDINDFINSALEDAKIQVDISLPYLSVEFPSKHLYEILYNRINSDLSLWQFTGSKHQKDASGINPTLFHPSFSMCKSGLHIDSDSDGSEDSDDLNFKSAQKNDFSKYGLQTSQSNLALNINITKGVLDLSEILKDSAGNIIPDKQAEIYIDVSGGSVFAVTHYKGKPQQNYVCLKMKGVQVYHKTDMNINVKRKPSELRNFKSPPLHLDPILLKSNRDIIVTSLNPEGQNSNMFVAAISTQVNERHMKTIRIACSLSSATLCHRVTPSHNSWLTQFMDFFDVVDYPVKGYDSPQVITELYLHLWDCAIDYRPLYLPYCSVITLGNLSISSNIAARTKTSTLRFIAEEASLFISHKGKYCSSPANLKADYISVMHLGFFELSLRISDQVNNAKIDLKASNNVLNIRTCSDSASALANLIIYYASEGDLKKAEKKETEKKSTLQKAGSVEKDPSVLLPEKAVERVNDMMEDAMKDLSGHANNQSQDTNENPVDVFYFPGEGGEISEPIDWGDVGDLEEDFCVIDNETPIGCSIPKNGKPEVRILSDKKIVIKENHFNIGIGKSDQLVSPKYYPMPVYRYTLSDMNIIWCMYGGKDFSEKPPAKKNVAFDKESSDSSTHNPDIERAPATRGFENAFPGVYYNTGTGAIDPLLSPSHTSRKMKQTNSIYSWQLAGGEGRQHNVLMEFRFNKVKFQHEIYPDKTQQASRQVLLIHEFEIRDRLSSSQINKFLYQYSSESNPRQSHANMILIKALHLRPDSRRNIQETCLKVSLLPLRLNIDQDSLQFLVTFFTELSGLTIISEDEGGISNSTHSFPVMGIDGELISPPTLVEQSETQSVNGDVQEEISSSPGASPTFIRSFVFSPDVPIRIDYVGKHVDLTHGPFAGLLMGLAQLSCLQIRLKRLNYKHGLLGFEKLFNFAISEWVKDIKKSQVPGIIGGVGPMHALVQLFQGIRDLFWLPIEQYQKDGRIVRGLQRGANSFTTSTAIAALELTARIVQAIQSIAEAAFDMVSPGPSVRRINGTNKHKKQHLFSHPADIREGVANAITLVKEGIGETAETLVRVASAEAEQKGAVGAVGGVLRQIPPTVVTPIILASAATSNLLGGVRSQLAPDTQREATNKWKQNITHK